MTAVEDLHYLTIREALQGLVGKRFSSVELTKSCLERIEKFDGKINAFLCVDKENALRNANSADKTIQKNGIPAEQPLLGIPISFKDMFLTGGLRTSAGSKLLEDYVPQYSSTVVKRLKRAGAILLGKNNQDAWGHGGSGENTDFDVTLNPWDSNRVPGGSSSGSGAAVASGMTYAAGGTDTGGSVRSPAAFCNVVGLKPTYGRVSRYGIVAMGSSLDSIGHLTRSVWDAAYMLEITAGSDAFDATTADKEVPGYTVGLDFAKEFVSKVKIGLPKEYFSEGVNDEVKACVRDAAALFAQQGAVIKEISLPYTKYGIATYYITMPSEVSSNLARYDGIRYGHSRGSFGSEAKRRVMLGSYTLTTGYYEAYYKKAMEVRTLIQRDFTEVFKQIDVLIAPVSPGLPFKLGAKQTPLKLYLSDIFVEPANLAGIPALALPCGFSEKGLPIGMQIMGPQFSEVRLFQVGYHYQQHTDWHKRTPRTENLWGTT